MALVYVVEDDEDLGALLQMSLETAGHRVQLFVSASHATDAFRHTPSDVVVTDMIIKEQGRVMADGGLSAIWAMKRHAATAERTVLVIAISGAVGHRGMQDILTTADRLGADFVMEKPFDPDDLLFAIEHGLAGRPMAELGEEIT